MPTYRMAVEIQYPGGGGPGINTWHARVNSFTPGDGGDVDALLEAFYTDLAGLYPSDTTIVGPAQAVDVADNSVVSFGTPWEVDGVASSGHAPLATCITTTWYSDVATRSGRGRTFLGPIMQGAVDGDGEPTGDVLALIRGAAADFVTGNAGLDLAAFGVYSQTDNVIRDIVRYQVHDAFASLRSRRP
jgi:hypothetical protein